MQMLEDAGKARVADARARGRAAGLGRIAGTADATRDIRGCRTEFAAALVHNPSWRPRIGDIHALDIGDCINVRSTILVDGRLIIKPNDKDVPTLLVMEYPAGGPDYLICGWFWPQHAKIKFRLETQWGDPAHFVPQNALNSNAALKAWIVERMRDQADPVQIERFRKP